MFEKKVKSKDLESPTFFSGLVKGFLDIHSHRYFRRTFCLCLIVHMITILVTNLELGIPIPISIRPIFEFFYKVWPIPTFPMTKSGFLDADNLLFKSFEILVILLYTVDLLPKIFVWKKSFFWKLFNIAIITAMVIQVPLTMSGYMQLGMSKEILKIRTLSIGVSLLLLLEILSIREQKTIKSVKSKTKFD